ANAAAPGIFVANGSPIPNATAARGQIVSLYLNGVGVLSPAVSTGAAPPAATPLANLPVPQLAAAVSVGGALARIDFIGEPCALVGARLVNYEIPAPGAVGPKQVVVTVGGFLSAPATITITN